MNFNCPVELECPFCSNSDFEKAIKTVRNCYIPSPKNGMVKGFFAPGGGKFSTGPPLFPGNGPSFPRPPGKGRVFVRFFLGSGRFFGGKFSTSGGGKGGKSTSARQFYTADTPAQHHRPGHRVG